MNEFVELLDNFWVVREENPTDYFRIKRSIDNSMKRFISDYAGWKLIINNRVIKLEKLPAEADASMGIERFESINDYCLLCALLIYLDDKFDGEQFLLTELIENIEKIINDVIDMNFTRFTDRKSLVRMLRFAQEMNLVRISEGSLEHVENDRNKEILYENTGLSAFFSIHHDRDISSFTRYTDFEENNEVYSENDKGYTRTSRVYRRLLLKPAMYWEAKDDPDGIYIKNQRNTISNRLDKFLEGRLDIHNGSAFYMLNEENTFGKIHPSEKMLSGFTALLCSDIKTELLAPKLRSDDNKIYIPKEVFDSFIIKCKNKYYNGLSKEFRELTDEKLILLVKSYMSEWMMLEANGEEFRICDGAFKTSGHFPNDFSLSDYNKEAE